MSNDTKLTVKELAKRLGAELIGDGASVISSVGPLSLANGNTVTFMTSNKHLSELRHTVAGAVILEKTVEGIAIPQIVAKNANAALIEALKIFAPKLESPVAGIHPTATLAKRVKLGKNISIGPYVVIEDGVEIGDETIITAGCKIGQQTKIGHNCRLDPNVVLYPRCIIGNNVIIKANSTIGSTGFGYAFINGAHQLIPHNGIVVIEDFVEIGANCCIDRAKFGETRIGAGTKTDNFVQIGHNVTIGKCCLIVALVGIAGSVKIGDGVVIAGQVGIVDNVEIGNGAMIGAQSCVFKNIGPGMYFLGSPAIEHREKLRVWVCTQRLPKFMEQFKALTARVEKIEAAKDNKKSDGR